MNDRLYALFRVHAYHLETFKEGSLALWATRQHVQLNRYTEDDLLSVLAEHERRKADPSPMVHLSQQQLDRIVRNASYPMSLPTELGGSTDEV